MRVGLLAVDGMVDAGYALIRDVLDAAHLLGPRVPVVTPAFESLTYTLAGPVTTALGLRLAGRPWRSAYDDRLDLVSTPSLGLVTAPAVTAAVRDHPALTDLTTLQERGVGLAGACSGTFFLAEAGVLDGRNATTSWWLGPAFRARYPRVDLDESQALAVAGPVTTAGAALAHVDLALSFVRRVSPALAHLVGHYLAVGDRPRQAAAILPSVLAAEDPVLSRFDRYVPAHLAGAFTMGKAARALGVSERTLHRITTTTLGMPPLRYVQQVRLDQALHLIRTSDQSLDRVAAAVGYRDAATLRALIRRRRGTTVTELRRRPTGRAAIDTGLSPP